MRWPRPLLALLFLCTSAHAQWLQWGYDPRHTNAAPINGQQPSVILSDLTYDPFVDEERHVYGGDLLAHFQAPLTDGDDVFMEVKSGTFSSSTWSTQVWNVVDLRWINGRLVQQWITPTDWKPPDPESSVGPLFEPVFHPLIANGLVYVPAVGGSILRLNRKTGAVVDRITPFGATDPTVYVSGPLTADGSGNVYYNVLHLDSTHPWSSDAIGSWLVKITAAGTPSTVSYSILTEGAPRSSDSCVGVFATNDLPWPPAPNAIPPSIPCGSQRPGLNIAPAIAPDGTIYSVSRAHFNSRYAYLVAVNPDLTPKWIASMRNRFHDGCNVLIPANGTPGGCRADAITGIDPADNLPGSGRVNDDSTSSPVVAPDGSIVYGAYTRYNYAQGHLMHFGADGSYLGSYIFGWDITPAVTPQGQSYAITTKENHYGGLGSYCDTDPYCPASRTTADPESYFITRLSPAMEVLWKFKSTNTESCQRDSAGAVTCVSDHPSGFEWCVNAPAVDGNGTTFANSEDGYLYAIDRDGTLRGKIFLQLALGAAYTPLSLDAQGRVYTQNAGHLFVTGSATGPRRRVVRH